MLYRGIFRRKWEFVNACAWFIQKLVEKLCTAFQERQKILIGIIQHASIDKHGALSRISLVPREDACTRIVFGYVSQEMKKFVDIWCQFDQFNQIFVLECNAAKIGGRLKIIYLFTVRLRKHFPLLGADTSAKDRANQDTFFLVCRARVCSDYLQMEIHVVEVS